MYGSDMKFGEADMQLHIWSLRKWEWSCDGVMEMGMWKLHYGTST